MSITQQSSNLKTGTWQVDPTHSSVGFSVKHMMIAKVNGKFEQFQGHLEVKEDGAVEVVGQVEAASINTGTADRDEHLRSADFFDVETYPQIAFHGNSLTQKKDDQYLLQGQLTIHGVSKGIELEIEVGGSGQDPWGNERLALEARGQINRRDYGLTWNQALEAGGVLVGDKVKIHIDISAVKED